MRTLSIALCSVAMLGSCGESARKSEERRASSDTLRANAPQPSADTASISAIPPSTTAITEAEIRRLMGRASDLYWSNYEVATEDRTTIDSMRMVGLDPAKVPTIQSFRDRFRGTYNERAIDTLLADFRIIERDGRLWMAEADGGDISDYEGTKLLETRADGENYLIAVVSVPLGAEGESEERVLRLERTPAGWRIESERPR